LRAEGEAIHRLALLAGGLLRIGKPALAMTSREEATRLERIML
jgi:hypothetical protein